MSGGSSRRRPLWCLHGALGEAADWSVLAATMAAREVVVRSVDLWRFLACCPMGLPAFGRALNDEARGGGGGVLVGYSMGGRLALHALLEERPHPWRAAVIISAHPGLEVEEQRARRRAADAGWAAKALRGDWRQLLDEWNSQPVLAGGEAVVRGGLEARRREMARSFIDWSLGAQQPLWSRLGEIEVPVLWVAGERDGKFRKLAERAVALLPDGCLWTAAGAGHRVPWQVAEAFDTRVAEFLEQRCG